MTTDIQQEQLQYIDLGVGRMTCDDCVQTVTAALKSVPGVQAAGYNAFVRSRRTPHDG